LPWQNPDKSVEELAHEHVQRDLMAMRKAELKEEEEQKSREVSISFTTTDHIIMFFASQVTVQRRQEKLQKAAPNVRPVFAVQTEEEKDATAEHKIEVEQKAHLVRPVVFYLFYSPCFPSNLCPE
jgi:hypothetical protein